MNKTKPDSRPVQVQLPPGSPSVRVVAGAGAAGEKCWNLNRCVTLIGSQRKAHIVLHDAVIAKAHCVIVNTGSDVLLMDLHTVEGTICNGKSVSLAVLHDGDVIDLGETRVTVAISGPPASGSVAGRPAPTRLARTLHVSDVASGTRWNTIQAVAVIGRSSQAEISVPGADVDDAHAVLFRLGQGMAVCDLGGGITVDGQPASLAPIRDGQVLQVGAHRLRVGEPTARLPVGSVPLAPRVRRERPTAAGPAPQQVHPDPDHAGPSASAGHAQKAGSDKPEPLDPIIRSLSDLEREIASLQTSITDSWKRLNQNTTTDAEPAPELNQTPVDLMKRSRDLDELEASLRGQLHDLTRCQEQLAEKERDLAAQAARIHEERLKFFQDQAAWAKRKAEITRRAAELDRRDRLITDREAKLAGG